jgi:hypothetical protein
MQPLQAGAAIFSVLPGAAAAHMQIHRERSRPVSATSDRRLRRMKLLKI